MDSKNGVASNELIMLEQAYESLRENNLDLKSATAELVDNSYQACATEINVIVTWDKNKIKEIVVADNGDGMDAQTLVSCLRLGDSVQIHTQSGKNIGRYGVGMVLASISLARNIRVYTRQADAAGNLTPVISTYIDLDEIHQGEMRLVPSPVESKVPNKYERFLSNSSGTIIILSNCDRASGGKDLPAYLGQVFRKKIENDGLKIIFNDNPVFVHDPLFLSHLTRFDFNAEKPEVKAKLIADDRYEFTNPATGITDHVLVKISLLDKSIRCHEGDGGSQYAKDRRINRNEGYSLLREGREVNFSDAVKKFTGRQKEEIDRWWGLEIDVPASLDYLLKMEHIKNKIEPSQDLLDRIAKDIERTIRGLKKIIRDDRRETKIAEAASQGKYTSAEDAMAASTTYRPHGQTNPDEVEKLLDGFVQKLLDAPKDDQEREEKKERARKRPYTIEDVSLDAEKLFEYSFCLKQLILGINVHHPYNIVFQQTIEKIEEDYPEAAHQMNAMRAILYSALAQACAIADEQYGGGAGNELGARIVQEVLHQLGVNLATYVKSHNPEARS